MSYGLSSTAVPAVLKPPWPDRTTRVEGRLKIGGFDLDEVADTYGTPLYIVDTASIRRRIGDYHSALATYPANSSLHYAAKAYLSAPMASLVSKAGCLFDFSSFGEIAVAMAGGADVQGSYLHGNAKPAGELKQALRAGVRTIVADNLDELVRLAKFDAFDNDPLRIVLRMSPEVATQTHPHIRTGDRDSKFGIPLNSINEAISIVESANSLRYAGLHFHLGSQLSDPEKYEQAIDVALDVAQGIQHDFGLSTDLISPGGGIGIAYRGDQAEPSIRQVVERIADRIRRGSQERSLPLPELAIEPGRSIIGPAMVAIYTVLGSKILSDGRPMVHVDGGMGDNLRPAMYGATVEPAMAIHSHRAPIVSVDISGRYCESGDMIARAAHLPQPAVGDRLVLPAAGAYTLSMASNYNGALRPPVVAVVNQALELWQRRETYQDLLVRDQ